MSIGATLVSAIGYQNHKEFCACWFVCHVSLSLFGCMSLYWNIYCISSIQVVTSRRLALYSPNVTRHTFNIKRQHFYINYTLLWHWCLNSRNIYKDQVRFLVSFSLFYVSLWHVEQDNIFIELFYFIFTSEHIGWLDIIVSICESLSMFYIGVPLAIALGKILLQTTPETIILSLEACLQEVTHSLPTRHFEKYAFS